MSGRARSFDRRLAVAGFWLSVAASSCQACDQQDEPSPAVPSAPGGQPESASAKSDEGEEPSSPFRWTTAPERSDIPDGALVGVDAGETFRIRRVTLERLGERWRIRLLESATGEAGGVRSERAILIDLPEGETPKKGATYRKALSHGDGLFHRRDPHRTGSMTSYTGDNAYVVELTGWEGDRASLGLVVVYPSAGDFDNAFAAGRFEDAVVGDGGHD